MLLQQNCPIHFYFQTNKKGSASYFVRTCFEYGQTLTQYATDLDQTPNRNYLVSICTTFLNAPTSPERCPKQVRTQGEKGIKKCPKFSVDDLGHLR